MKRIETLEELSGSLKRAVIDLLFRIADDELILGHRNSEWTGMAPILEEDIAFSSMAQDEMGHALQYYELLHRLGEADPDSLAFKRGAREYRCAAIASLPNDRDWAFCVLRSFLYDSAEMVRLQALSESALVPLAQLATKLRAEEKYHLMHGRTWVLRLGDANEDAHVRMQAALEKAYPAALGLFEETEANDVLAQAGICPHEEELCGQWASAVAPVLTDGGLEIPEGASPMTGGRVGKHPPALAELLEAMQLVSAGDPEAKW